MKTELHKELDGWFPVRIVEDEGHLAFQWMLFDEVEFSDPFFDESINRARVIHEVNRYRYRCVTTLDFLTTYQREWNSIPQLVIFHVSRCGSTLLAQLFNEISNTCVLAEVPLIDQLLALKAEHRLSNVDELIYSVIRILGRNKSHIIIKADSWHLFHYEEYHRLFHETAAVLLHRNPDSVFASHSRFPGMQTVIGLLSPAQLNYCCSIEGLTHLDYFNVLLGKYFSVIGKIAQENVAAKIIAYEDGVSLMIEAALSTAGMEVDSITRARISERGKFHSKSAGTIFSEDEVKVSSSESNAHQAYTEMLRVIARKKCCK